MHLVQILLPLYDNGGQPLPPAYFAEVRRELVDRFQGLTTYARAPARGLWKPDGDTVERDDIVVYEVMAQHLDRGWWASLRQRLEQRFGQGQIVIRALQAQML
jgi:hypothetical protein